MTAVLDRTNRQAGERGLLKHASDLLNQQIWCWGRDILRPEGNWLIEFGFQRMEAPADRENCSSVYLLELPEARRVVLRGFGVFYGDDRWGGIFLSRYVFRPKYTTLATLERPPWSDTELPKLSAPDESQRDACVSLTLNLIDWIRSYEATIAERLGTEYRQSTLDSWKNSKQPILPAEELAGAWRSLGVAAAENPQALISPC